MYCQVLIHVVLTWTVTHNVIATDPEASLNATQIIRRAGYVCEEHLVHTHDGFIMNVQRIPHSKSAPRYNSSTRPVVLLMHGLVSCSACFVDNLVNQSMAFLLANEDFDVWMGNNRGNSYARMHETLKPTDNEFWAWSWDEMAKYDLPATINYILSTTKQEQLYFVGYSQGNMIGFAEFSRNEELAKKIKLFIALAPVTDISHIQSPVKKLATFFEDTQFLFDMFGKDEFMPSTEFVRYLSQNVCDKAALSEVCENIFFIFGGYDSAQFNVSRIPVYGSHTPAGTSVQNMVHYAQGMLKSGFYMYDYGSPSANMHHYNQTTPPAYNISNMNVPVVSFAGGSDWLADATDVNSTLSQVQHLLWKTTIPHWEHMDFIWAMDSPSQCYKSMIKLIKEYY